MVKNFKRRVLAMVLILTICIGLFLPLNVQANNETEKVLTDATEEEALINDIIEKTQMTNNTEERLVDDTENNIYYISNIAEIVKLDIYGNFPESKFFLTTDLDFSSTEIKPLCNNFQGTLDGCGHTITFNIDEHTGAFANTQYLGLFSECTGATIKNLYVNANISLTTGGSFFNTSVYVGGIAGSSTDSIIENVHVSGNINILTSNDNSPWVGGIVGEATNTKINLSSNASTITTEANSYVGIVRAGGLCGEFSGTIENCYNKGDIKSTASIDSPYAGGLVGINNGIINKSYNSGKVQSKGPSTSMSDIYAGGIAAKGENGSSVTECAVMSPEISVTTGWINTGYKYIIANGGNKSNNISINTISGSPTNDSNIRYTQDELKTSAPYKSFNFMNIWAIDGISNNGYPFLYINKYVIDLDEQIIPEGFMFLIGNGYVNEYNFLQTDDGFTLCSKPLSEILLEMCITDKQVNGEDPKEDYISFTYLCDWYLFSIDSSYGILKMRDGNEKLLEDGTYVTSGVGTSIPFLSFTISDLEKLNDDLKQGKENGKSEINFYNVLDRLINGKAVSHYDFSRTMTDYFNTEGAKGLYLIAEEYIRKVIANERDENGYITLPKGVAAEQIKFLEKFPNIYESENNRIKVKNYNLTYDEKCAILACHTANKSINNFVAENILHARWTNRAHGFLIGTDLYLILELPNGEIVKIPRELVEKGFYHLVKADSGIGEESTPKDNPYFSLVENALSKIFGDI